MRLKKSVFGSRSEHYLFTSLQSRWSKNFDVWPSLPFSSIVAIEETETPLSAKERNFFFKTSVDYTLCTKRGAPILSIEFDGLGAGYSRQGEYIQVENSTDPYRKLKLDLKLRISKEIGYPFYIISFEESKALSQDLSHTIVDGIIGQVLAKREFHKKMKTLYDENRQAIESLPACAQREYIQDLVLDAETIAELRWDPIADLASKYQFEATEKGITKGFKTEFLNDPPLADGDPFEDISVLKRNIDAMKNAVRVGCRIIIDTPKIAIIETVWIRNFEDGLISPLHIASNIAEMLAFKKAIDLLEKE